jgi:hypothetical protein
MTMYIQNNRHPFIFWAVVVFVVFLAILAMPTQSHAQTAEPTAEATLDAIDGTPADTPDETPELVDPEPYEAAIDTLIKVIVFLLGIGGVTAIIAILKLSPSTAKIAGNTAIDLLELGARFTKTPVDDAGLQRVRAEFNARIDQILLNMTPPAQAAPQIVMQALPGVPVTVAGTQLSVNEQVANIEAQLSVLRDYMTNTSPKDVVGGPNDEPDFKDYQP